MAKDDVRRVYWDLTTASDAPNESTYSAPLGDERNWCADLTISDVKNIMIRDGYILTLCGTGAPYFLMFKDPSEEREHQTGFFNILKGLIN